MLHVVGIIAVLHHVLSFTLVLFRVLEQLLAIIFISDFGVGEYLFAVAVVMAILRFTVLVNYSIIMARICICNATIGSFSFSRS